MSNSLSLRLNLKAIDKVTGPLRAMRDSVGRMGGALRESRDQLRGLQDQQKRLTAFRDMSRQSHSTRRALMDKREELRRVTQELGSTTGPTRRLTQQQKNAQREVDKLSKEYRQNRDRVRELARELPAGAEGARGFRQQQEALSAQIEATNRRLSSQQDALRRLGEANVAGRYNAMTGEVRRFARNVTVAGGIAAGSIFALSSSTASLGDDVAKTADKMGIGITELQQMHYAAERAGVGTEGLNSSMQRMVRRVGRAANGTGAAVRPLEQLGMSAEVLNSMRPEQAVAAIADALEDVESHGDKIAIMSGIFGNTGESLVNMLRGGSAELESLMVAGLETGYVLSERSARGAEDFQDALLDAQLAVKGVKNTIGAELMPAVTEVMREFVSWMRENREHVQAFARDFGEALKNGVPMVKDLAVGVQSVASTMAGVAKRAADLAGGFGNLAVILGALFAAKMIASIVMFGVGLFQAGTAIAAFAMTIPRVAAAVKVLSVAFAATPIGWIVAGVSALAYGGYLLWKNWGNLGSQFSGMLRQLKEAFSDGLGAVTRLLINWTPFSAIYGVFIGLLEKLGVQVPERFKTLGAAIVDGLIGGILGGLKLVLDGIGWLARSLWERFKDLLGINSPSRMFEGFGANIVEGLIGGISRMMIALRDRVIGMASSVIGWFKRVLSWSPVETLSNAWAGASDMFGGVWSAIKEAFSGGLLEVTQLLINWSPLGLLWRSISAGLSLLGIELPASLTELGSSIISGIVSGITGKLGDLRESITGAASSAIGWFKERLGINSPSRVFAGFGDNIIGGIVEGVTGKLGELRDSITGAASSAVGWFKDRLGINSPSRVFAGFGNNITEGLANGIEDDAATPLKQVDGLTKRVRDAAAGLMLTAGIASPAMALDVQSPNMPEVPGIATHIERPGSQLLGSVHVERPELPALGALEVQRPELPTMPGLYAHIERPELPALERLGFQWPELPQFDPLRIDTSGMQIDARPPLSNDGEQQATNITINLGGITVNAAPGMDEKALARLVHDQVQRALKEAEHQAAVKRRSSLYDLD